MKKKIQNEEVVFENDEFIVLTDKYRRTSVGLICLLVPKQHIMTFLELSEENEIGLIKTLKLISKAMQKAYNCKGIRVWTAVNKEAGQSIFHCHFHIVPCASIRDRIIASFPGFYDLTRRIMKLGKSELKRDIKYKLAERIRKEIKTHM